MIIAPTFLLLARYLSAPHAFLPPLLFLVSAVLASCLACPSFGGHGTPCRSLAGRRGCGGVSGRGLGAAEGVLKELKEERGDALVQLDGGEHQEGQQACAAQHGSSQQHCAALNQHNLNKGVNIIYYFVTTCGYMWFFACFVS